MKIVFAIILFVHRIAHLPGFIVPWKLAALKDMPYKTLILAGRIDVGDAGVRIVGTLWLIAALAFAACGVGVIAGLAWWRPVVMTVAALSLVLCIIGWPEARIGVLINAAIIVFLLIERQMGWLS